MGILDKIRGNPIERMKTNEIMQEEIRLKNQIERIRKDINRIEKEKKKKFQEGIGADLIKKKMLAQEIKQLDLEAKLKMKNFTTLHKQYTFITNLVTIKKYEKQLRNTPIWEKLTKVKPEQLEAVLIKLNLEGKTFEEMVDGLNRVFEMEVAEYEAMEDEDEKKLMELWNQVEAGGKSVEEIEKELSIESKEKEIE
ncbi:MAG TPA: chromosome assembly protein [Thermoplasmata archaeon]|nr:chromosome assembly protein [Thermoplasmata archaeon]